MIDRVLGATDRASIRQASWRGPFPPALLGRDALLLNRFQETQSCWFEAAIDFFGCDPVLVRTEALVAAFLLALCDQLKVHRFGETRLAPIGPNEYTRGLVVAQVIETGGLVMHLATPTNAISLTIVTAQAFSVYRTAAFCQEWLSAQCGQFAVRFRGPPLGNDLPEIPALL